MIQLTTKWGRKIDKEQLHKEYPRPNLVRDSYFNLNGEWEYCINRSETTDAYDGKILVPFSPETLLSGVQRTLQPEEYLHYRKVFQLPEGFVKKRVLLHFGAVDQECQVYLNGTLLGEHKGGYLPFCFDITEALTEGENILTLAVCDWTEQKPHARGKQKLIRKGGMRSLFYTPQSGIWKTVWMESVEETYIEDVRITSDFDNAAVRIRIRTAKSGNGSERPKETVTVRILDKDILVAEAAGESGKEMEIALPEFKSWSPECPHLYDVEIFMGDDRVRSYFGMRKFSRDKDKNGIWRFFLNNKPFFFNGVLDQGYWPESLLTPPSDEALLYDIVKLKEMGYNTIRKHIKIESERFYYHCDREGMIVWQDMPNGGGDYNMAFVTYLPNVLECAARGISDHHYKWFKREDEEGRKQYYSDLTDMIKTLYNYPSIAVWIPFNEGWGQFDAQKATALIRKLDSGRLVNEACGWFDQKGGDMFSIHNYLRKLKVKPQKDRVVALTEYGGYAYAMEGHLACEKKFGYQSYRSKEELTANYKRLWEEEIFPNVERGLCSAIYTQTSDIEEEVNGIMTYDREEDKLLTEEVKILHQKLYKLFGEITRV